jgi:hypothetical protein
MSYFAKIQPTNNASIFTVTDVIAADKLFIDSGAVGDPTLWVQTSYNTHGNVHYAPSPPAEPMTPDGGTPLRANYAGIGYTYDSVNDVFYSERSLDMYGQVCNSWTVGAPTWLWTPPVPCPTDGKKYGWDEATQSWVEIAP